MDVSSFIIKEVEESLASYEPIAANNIPFLTLYESDGDGLIDPQSEAYVTFLNELYDEEFDDAVANLVDEATAIHESQIVNETADPQTAVYQSQRILQQHFAPMVTELETMLGALETEFQHRDPRQMSDEEIDTSFNRLQPSPALSPNFEQFWGAIKRVAKKAVSAAKKGIGTLATLGLGPILNKLKALIKPLLRRVINFAIGKLPEKLQPIAKKLAERLPFLKEMEEGDSWLAETGDSDGEAEIQYEFNRQVANLLFARDEVEQEMEVARVVTEQHMPENYPLAELEQARERLVDQLQALKEGEDPTPHLENFLPALLPALRLGIQLAGRKRIVGFLAKFLAKLIRKFVGPQYTAPLSQAMVDVGLRLLQLETTAEDAARAAPAAVAATVEETVRRVAALPEYVLGNQEMLEGFMLEAFEQAAAANLPQALPEEIYRKRPDLGQARKYRGIWMMMPGRQRKCYKKFSRRIPIRLAPYKVAEVESFEGIPLAEYLEEQLGIAPGEEVEPILHLYEALPGTRLADIARQEAHTSGLGTANRADQLHPLTRQAALHLLGEAELGRDRDGQSRLNPHAAEPGERFYYLEVPGKRPLTATDAAGKSKPRRRTSLRLIFDFPKGEIRVHLFLSEVRAQEIAVKLRQNGHPGMVLTRLAKILDRRLQTALAGKYGRFKMIHETVTPDQWLGALKQLPAMLPQLLAGRLKEWLLKGLADYLKQHTHDFIAAAENSADGVTMAITLSNPPGFAQLRQALKGKGLSFALLKLPAGSPTAKFKVLPGYNHE